jgi:hypothetical protein
MAGVDTTPIREVFIPLKVVPWQAGGSQSPEASDPK